MPKPPPRSISGRVDAELVGDPGLQRQHPAGGDLEARRSRRSGSRCGSAGRAARGPGRPAIRRTASKASPQVIEKPNFWSSWAVAMYSWVCASTPAVTRTITRAVRPARRRSAASRSISSKESTMIRPTPSSTARRSSRQRSCCCRGSRSGPGRSRPAARRSARRRSRRRGRGPPRRPSARPSCRGTPCRRRRRRTPRTRRGSPGPGPEVGLVEDVRRGAVLGDQVGERDARRRSARPSTLWAVGRPQVRDQGVGVGGLAQPGGPA